MEKGKIVYVSYGSTVERRKEEFAEYVITQGNIPITGRLNVKQQIASKVNEDLKERAARKMVSVSDEVWVFGPISDKMWARIEDAITTHKRLRLFDTDSGIIWEKKNNYQFEDEVDSAERILELSDYQANFVKDEYADKTKEE